MPRAYVGHRPHTFPFPEDTPSVCLFRTENAETSITHYAYIALEWAGGRRKLEWPPSTLSCPHRLFGLASKERGRGSICSPSSIEYRYSPSLSPSSPFLPFLLKTLCRICVFVLPCVALPHMPSFPSPRLSIRSLLRRRNFSPARSPICISYRIVSYYIPIRISLLRRG
jgi:hypothetical protein